MRSLPLSLLLAASLGWGCDVQPPGVPVRAAEVLPAVAVADTAEDTVTTAITMEDPCAGFQQPGCVQTGCPEGQVCQKGPDCVPTLCSCDPETGQSICSLDCGGGTCVAAAALCEPVPCTLLCPFGFRRDERGCEMCQCRSEPRCGCVADEDCQKVVAGCCPCELGGMELAIANDCVEQLAQCPVPPDEVPCLAFDQCTAKVARCVAGECVLQNSL